MSVFPQTFDNQKPIYFPETWASGKTAAQLYEEWKGSDEFWYFSNVVQCFFGGLWMWFISVLVSAIYEMWKLHRLDDDDRNKIVNQKFIDKKFVFSIGFICFVGFFITGSLLVYDESTRLGIVKGYFSYIGVKWSIKIYFKVQELYQIWLTHQNDELQDEENYSHPKNT